jgi:hypothetical protein
MSKADAGKISDLMKRSIAWGFLWLLVAPLAQAACPPEGQTKADLVALQDANFAWPKDAETDLDTFAPRLIDCLSHADPEIRDEIAYQGLRTWLRSGKLKKSTRLNIAMKLGEMLDAKSQDRDGFARSFAALSLTEVVIADRKKAFLSDQQLGEFVLKAADYLENLDDYRGFDAKSGWRHGVAHGADLAAQLIMHPRINLAGVELLLRAVSNQVAPENGHFYIYGEPERLALPVFYAAQRWGIPADAWRQWFAEIADIPEQGSLFDDQAGLARRHNLQALLLVLYVNVSRSEDTKLRDALLEPVMETLKRLQ